MDLGLKDRRAVVTGSSRGLGRAVAETLVAEGARVVLCARGAEALERTRAELAAGKDDRVRAVAADLSTAAGAAAVLREAEEAFGGVDILVTNTGGPPSGSFESHDHAAWQTAYTQLMESVLHLVRGALPGMKERRWGRIVNVTSIAVKQPVDGLILSNAIRAAVTGFARTLANEVAPFGITVNNVMPGFTRTERLDDLAARMVGPDGDPADAFRQWERDTPMGRIGEPEEFAAMVAFLCSTRASFITGTSIPVDGGRIRSLL